MKNLIYILAGAPLVALLSTTSLAQDIDIGEITMDITDNAQALKQQNRSRMRNVVYEYMLENGDITQEELKARLALRETHREELRVLRQAGDEEALAARIAELRQERATHREEMREYINAHEDLATGIEERRREFQEQRRQGAGEGGQGPGNGGDGGGGDRGNRGGNGA